MKVSGGSNCRLRRVCSKKKKVVKRRSEYSRWEARRFRDFFGNFFLTPWMKISRKKKFSKRRRQFSRPLRLFLSLSPSFSFFVRKILKAIKRKRLNDRDLFSNFSPLESRFKYFLSTIFDARGIFFYEQHNVGKNVDAYFRVNASGRNGEVTYFHEKKVDIKRRLKMQTCRDRLDNLAPLSLFLSLIFISLIVNND